MSPKEQLFHSHIGFYTIYRDPATHLVNELKTLNSVYVKRFVGQASKENDSGLSQDEQAQILYDFREGKLNILVASITSWSFSHSRSDCCLCLQMYLCK